MSKMKPLPDVINGFRVIEDLGMVLHKSCTTRRCISECKVCGKRFEASVVALRIQEACSCTHGKKPLPESINGFRVIKEVEKDGCRRRYARAVCKKCDFEFTARTDIISKMKSCRCYENYPPRLVELSHSMRQRCKPENALRYKYHAGKGVLICNEWRSNKLLFCKWSMENGYDDSKTIDRIDVDEGYGPDNCRWVTMQEQAQNNSSAVLTKEMVVDMREMAKFQSCAEVARVYGIAKPTAWQAIRGITWSNV